MDKKPTRPEAPQRPPRRRRPTRRELQDAAYRHVVNTNPNTNVGWRK